MPNHLLTSDDEDIDSLMINALIDAGVDEKRARAQTTSFTNNDETSCMEIHGRCWIMNEANGPRRSLSVKGLGALAISTLKPNGDYWDFTERADRDLVNQLDPDLIIGSLPCTPFRLWNVKPQFQAHGQNKSCSDGGRRA